MPEMPPGYRQIEPAAAGPEGLAAWHSSALRDPGWDEFLRHTPCGQFQQSSHWAEFKAREGWQHHRVVLTREAAIVGGFQILWRKKAGLRIGYVSKGPVAHPESPALGRELARLLAAAARHQGLIALIMQAPDETRIAPDAFLAEGFVASNPMHVVEATYVVELNEEIETLRSRMSASLRRNLRKAKKLPTRIKTGAEPDLGLFFTLMAATCRRQATTPNPSSEGAIRRLWGLLIPDALIRVTLAECDGEVPAAKLSIGFGDRYTVWKKGWNGSHPAAHPNELLEDEALEWARRQGYRVLDFCSFNRRAAERMLAGEAAGQLNLSSRDEYHLRFGGRPQLLPRAMVLLPHFFLRWLYLHTYVRRERKRQQPGPP